jgi:predicted HTH transcriptional regulator
MDLTSWLEYFTLGLATQMREIQEKGEQAIKLDVISLEHELTERQRAILEYIFTSGHATIQDLSLQFNSINVRTIQRDLQKLVEKDLLKTEGSARQTSYFAANS